MAFHESSTTRRQFIKKTGIMGAGCLLSRPPLYSSTAGETERRLMGRTGLKASAVGMGAARTMEPSLVKTALDRGVNFIDTGRPYFNGRNEEMIGEVIRGMRDKVVIQSKMNLNTRSSDRKESSRSSKRLSGQMRASLEASLRALKTDYIDIMLIRNVSNVDILKNEAVTDFFQKAKEKGEIRACGFATHTNQAELVRYANESLFYDVMMVAYNHKGAYKHSRTGRESEWDQNALEIELHRAHANNLGIAAMKTCSAGPYSPNTGTEPSFLDGLRWILNHPFIHTMAVAMGNMEQIEEDVRAMYS